MTVTEATLDAANGSFWSGYNPHTTASISVPAGALAVVVSAIRELHANNAFTVSNSGTARVWTRLNTYAPATDHLVVDYWYNNTGSSVSMTVTVAYVNGDGFNDSVMSWVGAMPGSADPAVRPPRIVTTISSASTAQASGTPSASGSMFCLHYFQNAPTADVSSLVAGSAVDTSPASTFYFSGGPGSIGTIYQSAMNTQTASPVTVGATLPTSAQTFGILVEYFSAAPVVASSGAIGSVGSGTLAVPVPAGVASGSLIIAYIYAGWFNAATPTTAQFTPPDGTWTIKDIVTHVVSGGQLAMIVAYKYAIGSDSGTYAWTVNALGGTGCSFSSGVASRVTGGATSGDPFADAIQKGSAADGSSTVAVASFTPGGDNTLMTGYCDDPDSSPTVTVPSGWSSVVSNSDTTSGGSILGQATQSTAAATGTLTFTSTSSTYSKLALIGTFRVPVAAGGGGAPFLAPPGYMTPWAIASRVTLGRRTLASDFAAAPADPEGITDAATPVQDMVRAQVDPEGILDAAVPMQGLVRSAADPVGLLDTAVAQQDLVRLPVDPVGLLDTASVQQGMARTVADSVGLLDAASAVADNVRLPADPIGLLDTASPVQGVVRQQDDAVGITDAVSASLTSGYIKTQDDAVGLLDTASAVLNAVRQQDDSLGLVDTATAQQDLIRSATDPVGLLDVASAKQDVVRAQADAVGLLDTASATQGLVRPPADPTGIVDTATAVQNLIRTQADPEGITDSTTASLSMPRQVDDPIGLTDVASVVTDLQRAPVDPIGITDSVSATLTSTGAATVVDQVGLTDSASAKLDSVRSAADQVGLLDAASAGLGFIRTPVDPIGLSDTAAVTQQAARTTADSVAITDALALDRALPMNDPTALTDTVTASLGMNREADDSLGLTDSATAFLDRVRTQHDPVGISDSVTAVLIPGEINYIGTPIDSIGLTDSVVAVLVRGEISKPPDWHDQINGPLIPHRDQGISSLQWHDQINTSAIPSEETE